jgi:drug/metabolite transporter (DMT)-like permease
MLLVSTDSLFVRLAQAEAWDMAFLVSAFSLPIFLALNRVFERTGPRRSVQAAGWPLLGVATLGSISQISFITAVTRTAVSNVVVIVAAAPLVAAVMARLVLGERTSRRVWIAIFITGVGIAVVVSGSLDQPTLDGDLLALLAVVAFATNVTLWRRYPEISRYVGLAMSSALAIIVTAPLTSLAALEPRSFAAAATMGLVFSPAGRIANSSAPRFAPAAEVALFAPVETVTATLWAWLAFSEAPTGATVVGGLVIISGVFFGTFTRW